MLLTRRLFLPVLAGIPMRRASLPEKVPLASPRTRIIFGGDIMLSRFVGQLAHGRHDPASPFRDLAPVLASADIAFANLESPFSDRGRIYDSRMVFKAEPDMISGLELAGIDVVSTANNHSRDCGRRGVEFTLDWLAKHGIAAVGSGETAEAAHRGIAMERNGVKFGFLAYTYDQSNGNHRDTDDRVAVMDVARMRKDVEDLKTRADVVVVSMHAGIEYSPKPNEQQTEFAHAAIEAGAKVVAGHHPHVVEPWERYRDGVIFYSLGNLVFDQFQRAETQHGVLGEVVFRGTAIEQARVVPVDIVRTAPRLSAVAGPE
jgi:poly-gamma-glutamate capsule biosynthesis protein CapA/YwtB (metallophosphatase superfamily)